MTSSWKWLFWSSSLAFLCCHYSHFNRFAVVCVSFNYRAPSPSSSSSSWLCQQTFQIHYPMEKGRLHCRKKKPETAEISPRQGQIWFWWNFIYSSRTYKREKNKTIINHFLARGLSLGSLSMEKLAPSTPPFSFTCFYTFAWWCSGERSGSPIEISPRVRERRRKK